MFGIVKIINIVNPPHDCFPTDSTGTLRIGCQVNIALYYLSDIIAKFVTDFPKVKLEIRHEKRSLLSELLGKRDLDIIVSRLPFPDTNSLFKTSLLTDIPKSLFASRNFLQTHKLNTTLTSEQFCNASVILPSRNRPDTKLFLETIGQNITSPIEIAGSNEFIYEMIKRNVGIGYINNHCVNDGDDIVEVKIKGIALPKFDLGVTHNKDDNGKIVQEIIKRLKSELPTHLR